MARIETFKNQNYKNDVNSFEKKTESVRMALAQRLIEQCIPCPIQTKTTTNLPYFTMKTAWVPSSSSFFTTVATILLTRICTHFYTKLHDLLHGYSSQQPYCPTTMLPHFTSRMCSSELAVLESMSRMYSIDSISTNSEQIP